MASKVIQHLGHANCDMHTNLKELNLFCRNYLLGNISKEEERKLRERLRTDKPYRLLFEWLLLKWLKTAWLKKMLKSQVH